MDFLIEWSPEAVEDLDLIAEYIARDSEFYARSVVTEILSISRSLGEFPMLGRTVPELDDPSIRERLLYSYRLIYRIEDSRILIVAVVHGRRDIGNAHERFD